MVRVLYEERSTWLQGESSNQKKVNGGDGRKPPPPPPPSPPSSPPFSPPYLPPSTPRRAPPRSPKGHAKSPLLKLDFKFELPLYNGEVNVEKLQG